jgi:hypothetical protein
MVLCSCGLYFGLDSCLQLDVAEQRFTKLEYNCINPGKHMHNINHSGNVYRAMTKS